MKNSIIIAISSVLLALTTVSMAQDYRAGAGIRLGGFTSGISFKGFVSNYGAIEGIAGFGRRSMVTTLLYEHHIPVVPAPGLNLYLGGGGHVGFFGDNGTYLIYKYRGEKIYVVEDGRSAVVPGVDFIFGAEYKFRNIPIVVGMDLKPFIDFYDGLSGYPDAALNARFVF